MRRFFAFLFAAGLLSVAAAGCRHVAGGCDCDYLDPCYMRAPWAGDFHRGVHPAALGGSAEQLRVSPKSTEKKE